MDRHAMPSRCCGWEPAGSTLASPGPPGLPGDAAWARRFPPSQILLARPCAPAPGADALAALVCCEARESSWQNLPEIKALHKGITDVHHNFCKFISV